MTVAAKADRDVTRIRRPRRAIGVRAGIEPGNDSGERHDPDVGGLGHQPDMEIPVAALAVAMGGQRNPPVGRKAVANDGGFALRVSMGIGGARRRDGDSHDRGHNGRQHAGIHHFRRGAPSATNANTSTIRIRRGCEAKSSSAFRIPARAGRRDHSTSVNCSSRVRWMIEKLSSETSVSTVSPSGVT